MRAGPGVIAVLCIVAACSVSGTPDGDTADGTRSEPAFAGLCDYKLAEAVDAGGELDAAIRACGSIAEWTAATGAYPSLFDDAAEAIGFAEARCSEVDGLSDFALCHALLRPEPTSTPQVKPRRTCAEVVSKVVSTRSGYDPAIKACASAEEWLAATKPYPWAFPPAMVLDLPGARCAAKPALAKYPLCRELKALEDSPEARQARKEARRAERERQLAEQRRSTALRAERTLTRYRSSAVSTYANDVQDAVQRMYAANLSPIGLTRREREAIHRLMDKYRLPAVTSIREHLSFMDTNPATTCPGDLYRVDRDLARRWLDLLVRGNYPSTLTGEGRAITSEFDAAMKRTSTFLRNLDRRVSRCR